jgi:hypothetical protein
MRLLFLAVRALPVSIPAAILLATITFPAGDLLAEAKSAPNQIEEDQQRSSRWDDETAQRFFRKGAWREGVAYLGRALRLDPQNAAAARHLWGAVVSGGGDCHTLPDLALRQEATINAALFSPDGRRILTGSADKTARLWDATTGAPVGEPMRHGDEVVAAVFSPDGARIVTASKDRTARLWEAATLKPIGEPMRHEHPLACESSRPARIMRYGSGMRKLERSLGRRCAMGLATVSG